MLGALWLLSLGAVGTWGVWSRDALLTLTAALALLLSASLLLWQRYCLAGVAYRRRLSADRAFFGDTVELSIEVTNLKPLPLTWLKVEDAVPYGLRIDSGSTATGEERGAARTSPPPTRGGGEVLADIAGPSPPLTILLAMLPYQRVVRRMRVQCGRRGDHALGPASLESGDYLGALSNRAIQAGTDRLIVYPKIFPVQLAGLPSNQFLGRNAARRHILTDPVRTIGTREYRAGDPYRAIDWRASARRDSIMVRMFAPSTTPVLDIVVNFLAAAHGWSHWETDGFEFALSVAASLASYGAQHGWAVGLRGNGQSAGVRIDQPPSAAPGQLRGVLETLARAGTIATGALAPVIAAPATRIPAGATLLLITTAFDRALLAELRDQHRRGRPVLALHVAPIYEATPAASFPILRIDQDAHWMERNALVLAG
jgi:uncharacterized repeat protein (TIGR01451 family)